ncbi:MAG: glycosyltransferase family 39 protein [Thermomicrobiales bacterium]|nr:glycosyltransferase family 39 protein [Thermomicrobiales bacterium]
MSQQESNERHLDAPAAPGSEGGGRAKRWLQSSGHNRTLLLALVSLAIFAGAIWDISSELRSSPFHPDESRWINRAYYLRETLNPLSSVWEDRYLIRGQPPMGSYMTGLFLLAQGRDLDTNRAWDFHYGFESNVTWNVTRNAMPAEGDLMAARRGSMVVAALTAVALFLIVAELTNILGGVLGAAMLIANPLNHYLATLATSDAVFTFFVSLSVLAAVWLAKKPTWGRAILLGLAMAAGASTKLSPLGLAAGFAVYGGVLLVDPWLRSQRYLGRVWRWINRLSWGTERPLGWMLGVQPAIVGLLFIITYPYLWSAPIERVRFLFAFRRKEMDNQAGFWPQAAIGSRTEALERTWQNLNDRYSSSDRVITGLGNLFGADWSGVRIDLYLALPGLLLLVYLAWRRGLASPHALAAAAVLGQSALILLALGVDFNRYYLPLLFATSIGAGVLGGCAGEAVLLTFKRFGSPGSLPAPQSSKSNQVLPVLRSQESPSQ